MEVKPGSKQTEVGLIPEDWDAKTLGGIGESLIGLTYKPTDVRSDGVLVLRASNIQESTLRFEDNVFVDMEVPDRIMARVGDILICVRNGSRELIGKCALLDERAKGMTFGAFMAVFRTPAYGFVYHQFQSAVLKRQINKHLGATINQITNKSLNSFSIPLPRQQAEQEAIAEALSDADGLSESLKQLLTKKRQLKHGAMQELLTGKTRLPGFSGAGSTKTDVGELPSEWRVVAIGLIADVKTGPFGSSLHGRDYVDDGTPIITVEHLGENNIIHANLPMVCEADRKRLNAYSLEQGDVVFSRVGSVDRNALVTSAESGWLFSGRLLRVRAPSSAVDTRYLSYQFHSEAFKQRVRTVAVGQTMASLNTQILKGVLIALPPLQEQAAIAGILSDMDTEIAALDANLAKARALKHGMMQDLLTGRIRLI